MTLEPFHLAIPVHDLGAARDFYGRRMGCPEGRSSAVWIDFDFFGHQLVAHLDPSKKAHEAGFRNDVDGHDVPIPHFGIVLSWDRWQQLADRLKAEGQHFELEPGIRFAGQVGEQATMFFFDPSGNPLEFKAFKDPSRLFAK